MKSFNEIRREVLFEALEEFPEYGNMTIAKMLYNKHPELWSSLETTRTAVRGYRGAMGPRNLKYLKNKKYVRQSI
jgi:hypothetical protein